MKIDRSANEYFIFLKTQVNLCSSINFESSKLKLIPTKDK